MSAGWRMQSPRESNMRTRGIRGSLIAVAVLGLAGLYVMLYLRGLDFGRPIIEHHDEWMTTGQALSMLAEKRITPPFSLTYGTFGTYIQCGVCAVTHLGNTVFGAYTDASGHAIHRTLADIAGRSVDRDQFNFYLAGRISSAVYAGLLFIVVFMVGRRLFESSSAAFLCVLAAMTHRLLVQQAHFSLPNVLAALMATGATGLSLAYLGNGKIRVLYLAALSAGLAAGTKLTMGLALAPVLLAATLAPGRRAWRHVPLLILTSVTALLIVEPALVLDYGRFRASMALLSAQYGTSLMPDDTVFQPGEFGLASGAEGAVKHPGWCLLRYWIQSGWLFFLFSATGLAALPILKGRAGWVLLSFPALYALLVAWQPYIVVRSYVPLVPFWALGFGGAALLLNRIMRGNFGHPLRSRMARGLVVVIGWLILADPAQRGLAITRQFATPDPLQTAYRWCEANIPPGSKVLIETAWRKQQLPLREDCFQVTRMIGSAFSKTYMELLDYDYVIAQATGMMDSLPWAPAVVSTGGGAFSDCSGKNRSLAESRLIMARRVTPEETGYTGPGEFYVNHNVYIYRTPKTEPVRVSAGEFTPADGFAANTATFLVKPGVSAAFVQELAPGEYDVFLAIGQRGLFPPITVRLNDETPVDVNVSDCPGIHHFVRTVRVGSSGIAAGSIGLAAGATGQVPVRAMVFVPVRIP